MKNFLFIFSILLSTVTGYGQREFQRDSLIQDYRTIVQYLEETHPDPYTSFGGRVGFRLRTQETEKRIEEGISLPKYRQLLGEFMAGLRDGHSYIRDTGNPGGEKYRILPAAIRVIQNGLAFGGLPDSLNSYLGWLMEEINGIPVDTLLARATVIHPTENNSGARNSLVQLLGWQPGAESLFGEVSELTFSVKNVYAEKHTFTLPFLYDVTAKDLTYTKSWENYPEEEYLTYRFVDPEKKTVLFRLKSVADRISFLMMRDAGMDYEQYLRWFYQQNIGEPSAESVDEMIESLPCLSEVFDRMLTEMKSYNAQNLIIDLRGNSGGMTPIVLPTLYQLFGDRYLRTDLGNNFYRMISPLYMDKLSTNLDQFNRQNGTAYRFGDISTPGAQNTTDNRSLEDIRSDFLRNTQEELKVFLPSDGVPVYTPSHIYVITDSYTFSAAFHYTFYLWKMGATVVGTSSSQAPNCFMEMTPFVLPYSGLSGSISNSLQEFLPPDDPRAREFTPDLPVTYDIWEKYGYDRHTPILYLLNEVIGK